MCTREHHDQERKEEEAEEEETESWLDVVTKLRSQVKDEARGKARSSGGGSSSRSRGVPQGLLDAIAAVRLHIPNTSAAAAALAELDRQLAGLPRCLQPKYTLLVDDETPTAAQTPLPGVRLSRATYDANDPSEDRSTVVVGDGFIFAGVWDGHGGMMASNYTQSHIFPAFKGAVDGGASISDAFEIAYKKMDMDYLAYARALDVPAAHFAGTCAIACYVDCTTGRVTCGNLGDSRAVMGVYTESGELQTVPLSVDHSADNAFEQQRIRRLHPHDKDVLVDMSEYEDSSYEEDPDWRVKKMCAFTRSLGDLQLKDKGTAALFNSYVRAEQRILPRPGVQSEGGVTPQYISNVPEIKEATIKDGFIIIACDGIWDEMTSEDAVQVCAELFANGAGPAVAELFIEETLKRAVKRINSDAVEDEERITLKELKSRPPGKADWTCRSFLHDDITVVILDFGSNGSRVHHAKFSNGATTSTTTRELYEMIGNSSNGSDGEQCGGDGVINQSDFEWLIKTTLGKSIRGEDLELCFSDMDKDGNGLVDYREFESWWEKQRLNKRSSVAAAAASKKRGALALMSDAVATLSEEIEKQKDDAVRKETNTQMMKLMELFDGLTKPQIRIFYAALDVDGNGTLDREEIGRLLSQVLTTTVTQIVLDTFFSEMDKDGSGAVDLTEFTNFFGVV